MLVRGPWVLGDRALEVEALAHVHVVHVLGHGPVRVLLDEQVNETDGIFVADWGVGPDRGLLVFRALVLRNESAGDVQAGDGVLLAQLEAELLGVVIDVGDLVEDQGNETLVAAGEALDCAVAGLARYVRLLLTRRWRIGKGLAAGRVVVAST